MFRLLIVAIFVGVVSGWVQYSPSHIRCWTSWFDMDNPHSGADRELLSKLRQVYPGQICRDPIDIEARTEDGLSPSDTGDVIQRSDTIKGFVCRNRDQPHGRKCHDYRVRFSCSLPFCGSVCWSDFYDRDNPSGTGDWEVLNKLREEHPGEICDEPIFIEVVTVDCEIPAINTGENFHVYSPTNGFVCRKEDQKDNTCKDYKVRFGCPCKTSHW